MSARESFMIMPLFVLLLIAAAQDIRQRRIPNWLSATMILSGLFAWLLIDGTAGTLSGLLGMFAAAAGPMALYCIRGMRAGDVKLMAGVGAWLGVKIGIIIFLSACLVAMVASLGRSVVRGELTALMLNSWSLSRATVGGRTQLDRWRSIGKPLPFAVMVLIAVVLVIAIQLWRTRGHS